MNELHGKSNADLLQVATSKNYGKSTRTAARKILEERGVTIDDRDFANPSAGDVPVAPNDASRVYYYAFRVFLLVMIAAISALIRYH